MPSAETKVKAVMHKLELAVDFPLTLTRPQALNDTKLNCFSRKEQDGETEHCNQRRVFLLQVQKPSAAVLGRENFLISFLILSYYSKECI